MIAQNGDLGVSSYVSQSYAAGSIGYVNYYYALTTNFPVALMLNSAGYYTEPTPQNVAVSLLSAQVDTTDVNNPALYLTQKLQGVYTDPDPRTYPLSAYSYLILPTTVAGQFNAAKGATLAAFSYYAMCAGQQQVSVLGYSPLPINLVEAGFAQIAKIPGADVQNINIQSCNNPTFSTTGVNTLAVTAPYPPACDKQGATQCVNGTGGAAASTAVTGKASAGVANTSGTSATGISTSGPGTAATSGTAVGPGASTCSATASATPSGSSTTTTTNTDCSRSKAAPPLGAPSPITDTLAVNTGWGSVQWALALAVAGLLLLIGLPALFVRWLGRRRSRRSLP